MPGKIIVITGANGGLGRALSQQFADDGEQIVLLGRTLSKVQEVADQIGKGTIAVECDVSSPDSVRAAFATIARTYPAIDVLINNAAVFGPYLIEEATDEQIVNSVMSNLAGPMLTTRSAVPLLKRGGHIINVSSESVENPMPYLTGYQSTKAGLETFSRHVRAELHGHGIRVTVVRGGAMAGPGTTPQVTGEIAMRFFQEATRRGINLMERGVSSYQSVLPMFRAIVDSSADLQIGLVTLEGRPPN